MRLFDVILKKFILKVREHFGSYLFNRIADLSVIIFHASRNSFVNFQEGTACAIKPSLYVFVMCPSAREVTVCPKRRY